MKVVVLEEGADLDALASAFGVTLLFEDAYVYVPSKLSYRASQAYKIFSDIIRKTDKLPEEFELVLVDSHNVEDYLGLYRIKKVYIYDHHPKAPKDFDGKVEPVGSTTTLVVEELMKRGISLFSKEATLLALGIYEDTGSLTYEGTTQRDVKALEWLFGFGVDLKLIKSILHRRVSLQDLRFLSESVESIEELYLNGKRIVILVFKAEEYREGLLEDVYRLREVEDSDAFFVIVQAGDKVYLFGRSIRGSFDVAQVLEKLGGGGHEYASALKLHHVSAERVRSLLVKLLKGEHVPLRVKDVMSYPPFVLHKDTSVKDAVSELSQRNFAGCPVVDDEGKVVGVVYKKNLLKVLKRYQEDPIGNFMVEEVHTLKEDDLIWKAEEILSSFGEKLIPVVDDSGAPVGVVTRFDILRILKEHTYPQKAHIKTLKLPKNIESLCREIGSLAERMGYKAYLVGGVVRDMLMNKEVWDLDVVVEGNAIELAGELARIHGVDLHPFPEFGTAHLKIDSIKLEFATTRRETYPHPGAYPLVEFASLREDLLRRDFTINAMAVSLMSEDFGTLIDYFGGLRDLKDKLIRVLHPLSFVEDPVRILRALRFAGRLGFRLSKSTEKLLIKAVELGLLKEAPQGRIFSEIRLALREENLPEIIKLYKKYRVLESLFEGFSWDDQLERRLKGLRSVIEWHRIEFPQERLDYGWLYLMLLLLRVDAAGYMNFLNAPSWVRQGYTFLKKDLDRLLGDLKKAQKPSEVYRLLKGKHLSVLLLLMSFPEVQDRVKLYLEKLRHVKVDPREFSGLSGPDLGKAMEEKKSQLMDSLFSLNS
ncbi:CBS domain-containing protein [Thermocrinis minervae]|uniref:tRNA nucleotidyltransferase (CCA-adding enzyme) n=1 Tax=Thermocrinis minervae TaxID=381751 RepID=A0A1M6RDF2_9AQUI|nr:CBS domain-containing protein [Thermocrinis minervae]SHK30420.1 tRNA nucleotidyltransferase (CCA-adding enzyme) [Thermocrinis minervae]